MASVEHRAAIFAHGVCRIIACPAAFFRRKAVEGRARRRHNYVVFCDAINIAAFSAFPRAFGISKPRLGVEQSIADVATPIDARKRFLAIRRFRGKSRDEIENAHEILLRVWLDTIRTFGLSALVSAIISEIQGLLQLLLSKCFYANLMSLFDFGECCSVS